MTGVPACVACQNTDVITVRMSTYVPVLIRNALRREILIPTMETI